MSRHLDKPSKISIINHNHNPKEVRHQILRRKEENKKKTFTDLLRRLYSENRENIKLDSIIMNLRKGNNILLWREKEKHTNNI